MSRYEPDDDPYGRREIEKLSDTDLADLLHIVQHETKLRECRRHAAVVVRDGFPVELASRKQLSGIKRPKVGDRLYVPPGDDRSGGMATISSVQIWMSAGKPEWAVQFIELPGVTMSMRYLTRDINQKQMRELYGHMTACKD